jgi:predicted O-methyltransferase YrrM
MGPVALPPTARAFRSLSRRVYSLSFAIEGIWIGAEVRRLAGRHATAIPTYTHARELAVLFKLAVAAPRNAQAVEIGSHLGASACYLAAGLTRVRGHLHCVDTWGNETMPEGQQNTYPIFERNVKALSSAITAVRKRSDELTAANLPPRIDLGFIDGDHSYEAARCDFSTLSLLMQPGAVLVFHDSLGQPGVCRVIGEALASGEWLLAGQIESLAWLVKSR